MGGVGGRNVAFGLVLAGLLAAGSSAQQPLPLPAPKAGDPPPPKVVPDPPRSAESVSAERARLQGQLQQLLKLMEERAKSAPPAARPPVGRPVPTPAGQAVDAVRAAMNYFRDKDYDAALIVAKGIDPATLGREDRAFAQYLTGSCLLKLGRRTEAAAVFREVANARDDEFLAECAVWQLQLLRSRAEIEAQIEQLRGRSKGP
jgi:tetratricopeptide (TPR) repeat protein